MKPPLPADTGLAELCERYFDIHDSAARLGRIAEVDELLDRGRLGHDIREEFDALVESLGLSRSLSSLSGGATTVDAYTCPLSETCGRSAKRLPGGPEPTCHVTRRAISRDGGLA